MLSINEDQRFDILQLSLLFDMAFFIWPFSLPPELFNIQNQAQGPGVKIKYLSGYSFEGDFLNRERSGVNGILLNPNNDIYYQGSWEWNMPSGRGMIKFNPYYRYQGEIQFGKLHGKGKIYYENREELYFGDFWIRNKMGDCLNSENEEYKMNCFYHFDPLFGYFPDFYRGPSGIFLFSDNFLKPFTNIFNFCESLENLTVNNLFFEKKN